MGLMRESKKMVKRRGESKKKKIGNVIQEEMGEKRGNVKEMGENR